MPHKVGGYDDGYRACSCFWGREPSTYVTKLVAAIGTVAGLRVLDVGCGEGKNTAFMHSLGASVTAIELSPLALRNARIAWPSVPESVWHIGDVRDFTFAAAEFDIVIAYGLLHCLDDRNEIREVVTTLQGATRSGGYNVLCAFNDRFQDLSAHPGFRPCLLSHREYCGLYGDWASLASSDEDLIETHPHNLVEHTHSITRLLAAKIQ